MKPKTNFNNCRCNSIDNQLCKDKAQDPKPLNRKRDYVWTVDTLKCR
jgi:hypothetical protein